MQLHATLENLNRRLPGILVLGKLFACGERHECLTELMFMASKDSLGAPAAGRFTRLREFMPG
ncbi:hypothetical protein GCM10009672_06280 [Nesterenkonia lutea]